MTHFSPARPIRSVPFFTPGTWVLLGIVLIGMFFWVKRFVFGLGAASNLTDSYPWGIWISIDVATGVALAAGGFTTSALAHIFHRNQFAAVVRPALLTAMLGYTFVAVGLLFDLGKPYNIWHPLVYWQGNSVLFEVGICVMCYLTVLYIEFLPVLVERFREGLVLPRPLRFLNGLANRMLRLSDKLLSRTLTIFILLGVVLSCLHQSSLGTLMLIAPSKVHPLYFTPLMPLMFLLSAICVGFPMVLIESLFAARSLRLPPEMDVLSRLARIVPILLFLYFSLKVVDLVVRGATVHLLDGSMAARMFGIELTLGVVVPFFLLLFQKVRNSPAGLLSAAGLVVVGVVLNRLDVFLVAYTPPYAQTSYFPALGEIATTASLVALLILSYRFVVMKLPIISAPAPAAQNAAQEK